MLEKMLFLVSVAEMKPDDLEDVRAKEYAVKELEKLGFKLREEALGVVVW